MLLRALNRAPRTLYSARQHSTGTGNVWTWEKEQTWENKRPKRALITKKPNFPSATKFAQKVGHWLRAHGVEPFFDVISAAEVPEFSSITDLPHTNKKPNMRPDLDGAHTGWQDQIDFCVAIGGDGTLLHTASLFAQHKPPPVLPFSAGSLSFLLPFEPKTYKTVLEDMLGGRLSVLNRRRLEFQIHERDEHKRPGGLLWPGDPGAGDRESFHVTNEIVARRIQYQVSGITEILCEVDGHELARMLGDGLILATPTGSSAYSMAAGGPIVDPTLDCMVLTPLCSVTLASRPLILRGGETVTFTPLCGNIVLEGKFGRMMQEGEAVSCRHGIHPLPTFTCGSSAAEEWFTALGRRLNYERAERRAPKDFDVD